MSNDTKSVAEVHGSFDRAARSYAQHAIVQKSMADWLGDWIPMHRTGKALELGAGTGNFTRHLLPWAGSLTASDQSGNMCREGKLLLPEIEWRVMSAETPQSGELDWIFSSSMLQWVQNPRAVFSGWRNALKPGGRILAGLFSEGSLPELRTLTNGWTPLTWRTDDEWADSIDLAGLTLVRSETQMRVFHHPSALHLLRSLHGVGAAPFHQYSVGRLRRLLKEYDTKHRTELGVESTWVFHRFEAERVD